MIHLERPSSLPQTRKTNITNLPQEIIDDIIDYFAYDHLLPPAQMRHPGAAAIYEENLSVLKACSLVSKAFSYRAQGQIYSTITVRAVIYGEENSSKRRRFRKRVECIFRMCASKPHIRQNIRALEVLLIDLCDNFYCRIFDKDVDAEAMAQLADVCKNVRTVYIKGFPKKYSFGRDMRPVFSVPYILLPIIDFANLAALHVSCATLVYSSLACLFNLQTLSLCRVNLIQESDITNIQTVGDRSIRLRHLYVDEIEDDILALLVHNYYGLGYRYWPTIMDLTGLQTFRQDHIYSTNSTGYMHTMQQMFHKSCSSLELLEVSQPEVIGTLKGWLSKHLHHGLPSPSIGPDTYNLSYMRKLKDVTICSSIHDIVHTERSISSGLIPSPEETGIYLWLHVLSQSPCVQRLGINVVLKTWNIADMSIFFSATEETLRWKYLFRLTRDISKGRSVDVTFRFIWHYRDPQDFRDTQERALQLEESFDRALQALVMESQPDMPLKITTTTSTLRDV